MDTSWENVVGHHSAITKLKQLLQENRLPHALLFTGAAGIGKTKVAEALAGTILCHKPVDGVPCGECPSCKAMRFDTHPDFYRMVPESTGKAAKSIKIEQVRALQEKASRVPALSDRSVAILESVETMKAEAANSILKTIEEPDAPITFILITSSPAALLDTIRSRCMQVEFGILSNDDVALLLTREGVNESKAKEMASLADGSIGKALELLNEDTQQLHKWAGDFLKELPDMSQEALWQTGEKLGGKNRDELKEWLSFFAMELRDMLLLYSGGGAALYNQQETDSISRLLGHYSVEKLDSMLKLTLACQYRLRYNVNLRLTMEAFIIRLKDIQKK